MDDHSIKNNENDQISQLPPLTFNGIYHWENALRQVSTNQIIYQKQIQHESPVIQTINTTPGISHRKRTLRNTIQNRIKQKKMKRIKQNCLVYWISVLCILCMGTQNLYIFILNSSWIEPIIFFPSIIIRILFFGFLSYKLTKDFKLLLKMIFILDRVFVVSFAIVISIWVFCLRQSQFKQYPWVYISWACFSPLLMLTFTGYIRTVIIFCNYAKWQIILIKIVLAIGGASYFGIGMYFTIKGQTLNHYKDTQMNDIMRNLIYLYAFAGFDLQIEIFSMFDEFDGTNKFRIDYKLVQDPQDTQYLLYGKKIKPLKITSTSPNQDISPNIKHKINKSKQNIFSI